MPGRVGREYSKTRAYSNCCRMAVVKPEIVVQEDLQETVESIKIVLSLWLKVNFDHELEFTWVGNTGSS